MRMHLPPPRLGAAREPSGERCPVETISGYLEALASDRPTPGGGSAATLVAANAAALIAMVARISARNPKYAAHHPLCEQLITEAERLRAEALRARERDEAAFERVVAASAMPKETHAQQTTRHVALELALHHAAAEPLLAAQHALELLRLAQTALDVPNLNLASDIGCAAEFAAAALAASAYNVRVNHRFMRDHDVVATQRTTLEHYEREAATLHAHIRSTITARLKPKP